MPLGTEVGLGPGHIRWTQFPAQKGHNPPIFDPCLLRPNGRPPQLLLCTKSSGLRLATTGKSSVIRHNVLRINTTY